VTICDRISSHRIRLRSTLADRVATDSARRPSREFFVSPRNLPGGHAATPDAPAAAHALRDHVTRAVRRYLSDLDGHQDGELHAFVMREVEAPLFAEVMQHCGGNLTRAAATLGINRATLRKRMHDLGLTTS